jgi:hypothetical protein
MKTIKISTASDWKMRASLQEVVNQLLKTTLPEATRNRNSIVNNVPSTLYVNANEDVVTSVIRGMLHAVVVNAADSVIYIHAKDLYGKMAEVNIKDENCYNTYAVALSLQEMVPLAEKIGGHLNIINQRQKITTISFNFPLTNEQWNS